MDVIRLLPDSVANQIAAGEVIQRPASCLKELVENSLDAGATHIRVLVRDAGRTLLQVVDNGTGMSETDARMAFERHATSKIREANDLFALRTMGFRGEALPSISAVAHVEVQTRTKDNEVGTLLEIAGGEVLNQSICQCPVGTNIKVKDLFYNVPVRRKFLKTDQTELRNLLNAFYHIVLVYPKVQFTFVSDDEVLMDLPASTEKQRIENIFGKGTGRPYTAQLVEVATDTELVSIRGFVGKPESAGKSSQQFFFVNGRFMRHPYFHKAVMTAYSGMLPGDYSPSYFIYFDISPELIDVNIHPTKTEIKFQDEQAVFQILMAAVRESLGKFNVAPSLDFNRSGEIEMPVPASGQVAAPKVTFDPTYNPFKTRQTTQPSVPSSWQNLYTNRSPLSSGIPEERDVEPIIPQLLDTEVSDLRLFQYDDRYIIFPAEGGLMFVNQHRAHTCVLYYRLKRQMENKHGICQQLLFQEEITLTPDEMVLMASLEGELQNIGFDVVQFSKQSYAIAGVPAVLNGTGGVEVLREILAEVGVKQTRVEDEWRDKIALVVARDAAIPNGRHLTDEQMRELLRELWQLPIYRRTPDGKVVMSALTDGEIRKRF